MRGHGHLALLLAILLALVPGAVAGADQPAPPQQTPDAAAAPVLSLEGLVKRPQQVSLENLRRLPAERVQVSFQTERGMQESSFTGVRLWALLAEAGGIDDAAKGAEFRHIIRITGRDGFVVVISTGEIAPDFGGVPALIA
jgi:DMSO/TMAO reductase YedYZ molybdopterin-dependent catalytic subunit